MLRKRVPRKIWDYGVQWNTQFMQRTSTQAYGLRVTFPFRDMTSETPDISEYLVFGFYDYVSYKDNSGLGMTAIKRGLEVSHRVGVLISYWILTQKVTVV